MGAVDLCGAQHLGSAMGAHDRHTTPETAARVVAAVQARLTVVVHTAEGDPEPLGMEEAGS